MLGNIERYTSEFGSSKEIQRNNTLLDGYVPILREWQGITLLIKGTLNTVSGMAAPLTNEGLSLLGRAQLKDGLINITCSPLMGVMGAFAIGYFGVMRENVG